MIKAILIIAALAALAGVAGRNAVSVALLASLAFSLTLDALEMPYNFVLWILPDLIVMLVAVRYALEFAPLPPGQTELVNRRDAVIIALFLPMWAIYVTQPAWGNEAVAMIFAVQLLLTFPARRTWSAGKAFAAKLRDRDIGSMMAATA